jgi:hypothetical protein
MKKIVLLLVVISCGLITSCAQKDCSCTATLQKKASSSNSSTYTVYDWGSSCSNVTSNDIPEISNNGGEYNISCTEL